MSSPPHFRSLNKAHTDKTDGREQDHRAERLPNKDGILSDSEPSDCEGHSGYSARGTQWMAATEPLKVLEAKKNVLMAKMKLLELKLQLIESKISELKE